MRKPLASPTPRRSDDRFAAAPNGGLLPWAGPYGPAAVANEASAIRCARLALVVLLISVTGFVAWAQGVDRPDPAGDSDRVLAALLARAHAGDRQALIEVFRQRVEHPREHPSGSSLIETLHWAERAWSVDDRATAVRLARFVERHCDDPLLAWHWLCEPGE
jgi:hypothetical protein